MDMLKNYASFVGGSLHVASAIALIEAIRASTNGHRNRLSSHSPSYARRVWSPASAGAILRP